jgi:hypothetical protein
MDNERQKWKPSLRVSVESLLERLRSLDPETAIYIDAEENRHPVARFVLAETGEIVGEIDKPPEAPPTNQ